MIDSLAEKIDGSMQSKELHRQAVINEQSSEAIASIERITEAAFEAVVSHVCSNDADLSEKMRFLFEEVLVHCEESQEVRHLLNVVQTDVIGLLKKTGMPLT